MYQINYFAFCLYAGGGTDLFKYGATLAKL